MELDDKVYEKIVVLCKNGDECFYNVEIEKAIEYYEKALELVPEPKCDWETSTWIYSALGDCYFIMKQYEIAKKCFYDAVNCPGGIANPFILMRLGQCLYECGDKKGAKEYFIKTYMFEGYKIFSEQDEKYFALIKENIE
ncbi:tetratricopeptide repeat protein [Clostridium sp. ZS2-4]|uniref:tetratricopeptide repeat protein n=1 Tax=Clostridium sp. ZS2-4 TaxID=2987703 RepID=UPI00227C5BF5|nr:tetratricopeptide repeat protein [Clostridium sp. ZS2-4]MCY6355882.1 tetratricopeptide repeat protein [Clostridium sp. ZS2-4]